jgi:hypothetical protein
MSNINGMNIVQPNSGGGSRGGWLGHIFGAMRERSMAQMQLDLHGAKESINTREHATRAKNEAIAKATGNIVEHGASMDLSREGMLADYDAFHATDPESKKLLRPGMDRKFAMMERSPSGYAFSSTSGVEAEKAKAEAKADAITNASNATVSTEGTTTGAPAGSNIGGNINAPSTAPAASKGTGMRRARSSTPRIRRTPNMGGMK